MIALAVGVCTVVVRPASVGAGPDLVGTWRQVSHCNQGWCSGQDFPLDFTIDAVDPATGAISGGYSAGTASGTYDGTTATITLTQPGYHSTSVFTMAADGMTMAGSWTDSHGVGGVVDAVRTSPPPVTEPTAAPTTTTPHGVRPSAVLVICNRDLTQPVFATFRCNAFVADASGISPSQTPTGRATWTATVGSFNGATEVTCDIVAINLGAAGCSVEFGASNEQIPIETAVPVTVSYAGDDTFDASVGSDHLGPASDISQLSTYGGNFDTQLQLVPGCNCGDPVDPGTGNLSLQQADVLIPGFGQPLGVIRSYNSGAAAAGATGRFGAGWSDTYTARLAATEGGMTLSTSSGAVLTFPATDTGYAMPLGSTTRLTANPDGSYVVTYADQRMMTFDANGALVVLSDRTGEATTLTYDVAGALVTVTDSSGRPLTFANDANGRVSSLTDPAGRVTSYTYDADGNLTEVTDVGGGVTQYGYDAAHRLVSTTDPNGNTATTAYDDASRVVLQVDPLGNRLQFTRTGTFPNVVTAVVDGNGNTSIYAYRQGLLTSATRAAGTPLQSRTSWFYDEHAAVSAVVDPNSNIWQYLHDANGNLTSATDPLGRTTTSTYDERDDITSISDPLGLVTTIQYDARGLAISTVRAAGTTAEATIVTERADPAHPGAITAVVDPSGARTTFMYDAQGDLVGSTDATGGVSTATFDVLGRQLTTVSPSGNVAGALPGAGLTTYEHDAYANVTKVTEALGRVSTATYDANHALVEQVDAVGNSTTFTYDANGRIVAHTLGDGSTETATFDAIGNLVSMTDAAGAVTTTAYDEIGRAISRTDPLGRTSRLEHDPFGNITAAVDPTGQATHFEYDAAGQLIGITYDDPATPPVTFAYDADGRRTSMTDGTGTTTYTYDEQSRLVTTTDGAGHVVTSTWSPRGDLVAMTYPSGLQVEHGYDDVGRLTSVTDGLGHTSTFTYDIDGALVSGLLGNGTTVTYARDAVHDLDAITYAPTAGGDPFASFAYDHDANGAIATWEAMVGDAPAISEAATYDGALRLQALGDASFATDPTGRVTQLAGVELGYDPSGQLLTAGPTSFGYDGNGRRTTATGGAPLVSAFGYDGAGRLTSTVAAAPVAPPTTEAEEPVPPATDGSTTTAGPTTTASPTSTDGDSDGGSNTVLFVIIGVLLLAAVAVVTFVLRRRGRGGGPSGAPPQSPPGFGPPSLPPTSGPVGGFAPPTLPRRRLVIAMLVTVAALLGLSWIAVPANAAPSPTEPSTPTEPIAATGRIASTYTYNGDGLRMAATVDGATASFSWVGVDDLPMLIGDGSTQFVHGPGGLPLEQIDASGTPTWFVTDHIGTVRALTDVEGAIVGTSDYDVYGASTASTGATSPIGFHGEYTDTATGLHYLLARYYDPSTAQFLTIDPLVAITHQPYAYAGGDPLGQSDPTGLGPSNWFDFTHTRTSSALAGHGRMMSMGETFTVPAGTWITFHAPPGASITDTYGRMIEGGRDTMYTRTYGPGDVIPDLVLGPPKGLDVLSSSKTVASDTKLSDLLQPNMGRLDWAACRTPQGRGPSMDALKASGEYRGPLWNETGSVLPGREYNDPEWVPNPKYQDWNYGQPPLKP